MISSSRSLCLLVSILLVGCVGDSDRAKPWLGTLRHELSHLGARNWVVVAEAAFPIHSRRGLRVIELDGKIPDVVDAVERVIEEKCHLKPRIYVATEAASVPYDYAPGIKLYRKELEMALHGRETVQLDHKMLLRMLGNVNQTYRVLVIKTRTALPYTSVFMEMGSGYWDAESESALREVIDKHNESKPTAPQ